MHSGSGGWKLSAGTTGPSLAIGIIILVSASARGDSWDWSAKAGLNYDFISHDYYFRTVDTLGLTPDSLLELKSTSDRINEGGASLHLDLSHRGILNFELSNRIYFTNEKARIATEVGARWRSLGFSSRTEFKSYNDRDDFSLYSSQFRNSSQLAVRLYSDERRTLELSQEIDYTAYSDPEPTVTGYYQSESRLLIGQRIGQFSDLNLSLRLDLRENYDSAQLDFTRGEVDLTFSRIGATGYFSSEVYIERRDYALPASEGDYLYLAPAAALDQLLSETIGLAPRLELHYYDYDAEDFATFSNVRLAAEAKIKYHYQLLSAFSLGLGADLFAATDSAFSEQDYRSIQLLVGFETFSSGWLSLSLEGQLGQRDYLSDESLFYTDHDFTRLDLLADLRLSSSLHLSLIAGADFEYHELKEDDIFVHMLSGTLSYRID